MNRWDTRTAFLVDPVSCVDAGFHEALGSRPVPAGQDLYLSAEVDVTLSYANRPGEPARTEALQILYPWEPQAGAGSYTMHTWLARRMDVALRQLERGAPGERDLRLSVAFAPDEPVYLEVLGADKAARVRRIIRRAREARLGGLTLVMQVFHWLADPHSGPPPQLGPSGLADLFE